MQHDPALPPMDGFTLPKPLGALGVPLTPTLGLGPRLSRFVARAVLGLALLILAAAGSLLWFRASYDNRVYPAIHVGGIDIGGQSITEAEQTVRAKATEIESLKASFTYEGQQWQPTLKELGVTVDADASLNEALAIGREGDARHRLESAWDLIQDDRQIPLTITLDEAALNRWFDGVNADLGIAPRDAELRIDDGQVTIVPEIAGTVVDRATVKTLLTDALATFQAPNAGLATVDFAPRVFAADLEGSKQKLEQALSAPVKLTYKQQSWTISAEDLGQFVVLSADETQPGHVQMALDRKPLAQFLSSMLASDINSEPVNATVGWNGETVVAIEPSVDGAKLKPTTLADAVSASFFSDDQSVEVPVAAKKPEIDSKNLAKLGITTRLAVGSSNFEGSDEGRSTNIRVGASLLNGFLIPPQSSFSFNHAVGIISEEAGFVESNVVDGERIGRDIGGGICQVSTTVFRAAFEAGLPIEELHPHRYRMAFYEQDDWPVGLDASILQPEGNPFGGGDFIFRNPTDSYMLMEAYTDGPRVVIILYGPDLGYKVDITGPLLGDEYDVTEDVEIVKEDAPPGTIEQTEYALKGIDVTFIREVTDRDGNLIESNEFFSHYYPRGNAWQVSPDMQGQSPAANSNATES